MRQQLYASLIMVFILSIFSITAAAEISPEDIKFNIGGDEVSYSSFLEKVEGFVLIDSVPVTPENEYELLSSKLVDLRDLRNYCDEARNGLLKSFRENMQDEELEYYIEKAVENVSEMLAEIDMMIIRYEYMLAMPGEFYKQSLKSLQSEAKTNLKGLFTAEIAHYGEFDRYGETFEDIGFMLAGGRSLNYCFYLNESEVLPEGCSTPLPADIKPYVEEDEFQVVAVGNIDEDPTLDVWSIDSNNMLVNIVNDLED